MGSFCGSLLAIVMMWCSFCGDPDTVGASARLRSAREDLKCDEFIQAVRVIVDDHREQARSHRICGLSIDCGNPGWPRREQALLLQGRVGTEPGYFRSRQ